MSPRRSDRLLESSREALERSARARFVAEATDGTIAADAFARYLAIEERFVRTAARVAGYSLWAQPDWETAEKHARTVADLVGPQLDYFRAVRGRWPADAGLVNDAVEASAPLSAYVLELTGREGYWAAVTCMFAAESLYARWCAAAMSTTAARSTDLEAWIALHTEAAFVEQVEMLASLVDTMPATIDDERAAAWFGGMLAAEDVFHDAAYAEPARSDNARETP